MKDANYNENSPIMGTCTLSDSDRRLAPNAFRIARDVEEYFENQCSGNDQGNHKLILFTILRWTHQC